MGPFGLGDRSFDNNMIVVSLDPGSKKTEVKVSEVRNSHVSILFSLSNEYQLDMWYL
jgi:hypothetical protein